MKNVIFVAPYFAETTLRFVSAVARLPGVRTALVSQDSTEQLPAAVRKPLALHHQVENGLDRGQILEAARTITAVWGPIHRLLGTFEELQVTLGAIRDEMGIPGMGAETALNFRDKSRMKDVLRSAGLPCARHALATSDDESIRHARALGFPLIVKPPAGSGARGTSRVSDESELESVLRWTNPSHDRPILLEEFVVGEEHSFDSMVMSGDMVWHSINHYLPSPLEVLREPWIQWCVLLPREVDDPRYQAIRGVAGRALRVLGMDTGMSHMEWFRRPDDSVAISEVGARPPGARFMNLISQAHDVDMFHVWARALVLGEFEPPDRPYAAGAAYLRGQGRGSRVVGLHGLEEIQRRYGSVIVEARLPTSGHAPGSTYEGDGYVIVRHPETGVVREALAGIVRTIRVQLGDA